MLFRWHNMFYAKIVIRNKVSGWWVIFRILNQLLVSDLQLMVYLEKSFSELRKNLGDMFVQNPFHIVHKYFKYSVVSKQFVNKYLSYTYILHSSKFLYCTHHIRIVFTKIQKTDEHPKNKYFSMEEKFFLIILLP